MYAIREISEYVIILIIIFISIYIIATGIPIVISYTEENNNERFKHFLIGLSTIFLLSIIIGITLMIRFGL